MTDVFAETDAGTAPKPEDNLTASNGAGSLVEQLVGADKKFKTVEDLAKGKTEADTFIVKLQAELAELRTNSINKTEVDNKFDDLLKRIEEQKAKPNPQPQTGTALGGAEIADIVRKEMTQVEANRTATQNVEAAQAEVVKQYGEKAQEFLKGKAAELNLSLADLKTLSAKSPSALLSLIGLTKGQVKADVSSTKGSVNTESNFNTDTKVGTWDYYQDMRRKNPQLYRSKQVQDEIFKRTAEGTLILPN